jgi:hypothetical protein
MDLWAWPAPRLPPAAKSAAIAEVNQPYGKLVEAHTEAAQFADLFVALEEELDCSNREVYAERALAVDALPTNSHPPRSSLLMLASAFTGWELALAAYRAAVERRRRFLAYDDCTLTA